MDRLGPYELRGELGRGAMAVVWRAWDPTIGREIALKEPKVDDTLSAAARDAVVSRFIREGRTAGQLNHPGIVTIYSADLYDGRPVIAMELIDGESLSAMISCGPLPAETVVAILDQLLDATAYAHARGIVHRDIKPDNIFVTRDGRVKLADFGIARDVNQSTITRDGSVMGTPGYMAPEQIRGEGVDARSDVFALGVIAHEMLTGRNPFGATEGTEPTAVMYRIVHEPAPALPSLQNMLGGADLDALIDIAMSKEPEERFVDAGAFRAILLGMTPLPVRTRAPVPTLIPQQGEARQTLTGWGVDAPDRAGSPMPEHRARKDMSGGVYVLLLGIVGTLALVALWLVAGEPHGAAPPDDAGNPTGTVLAAMAPAATGASVTTIEYPDPKPDKYAGTPFSRTLLAATKTQISSDLKEILLREGPGKQYEVVGRLRVGKAVVAAHPTMDGEFWIVSVASISENDYAGAFDPGGLKVVYVWKGSLRAKPKRSELKVAQPAHPHIPSATRPSSGAAARAGSSPPKPKPEPKAPSPSEPQARPGEGF